MRNSKSESSQLDKFRDTARQIDAEEDDLRFGEAGRSAFTATKFEIRK